MFYSIYILCEFFELLKSTFITSCKKQAMAIGWTKT